MKAMTQFLVVIMLFFSSSVFALKWIDLWQTADQQGTKLLREGKTQEAAHIFKNNEWQAVAYYRAGDFKQALSRFSKTNTSDAQYNAGNAAAHAGNYQAAITAYDRAIALNANNADAVTNREIVKKLMEKKDPPPAQDNSSKKNDNNNKNASSTQQQQQQQNNKDESKQQQSNQDAFPEERNVNPPQASRFNKEDEEKKQLFRRLTDDPGGLLRQKFMRDYFRRHAFLEKDVSEG